MGPPPALVKAHFRICTQNLLEGFGDHMCVKNQIWVKYLQGKHPTHYTFSQDPAFSIFSQIPFFLF